MAFMKPQVIQGDWYEVETNNGITFVPSDLANLNLDVGETTDDPDQLALIRDYCDGEPESVTLINGFGARFSAPGYMDCTEWTVFSTFAEAKEYLDSESDDDSDGPQGWAEID